ncbi:MAG: hypothetical protein QOJ53_1821 [Sphingomonadales bacterium]|jgi:hypothetical protein|nr:hypothetical protein [Sphingomonadales bacterium]MEA3044974.1 hypothetical protein [Sphingomonadales bacterium]MEA3047489.1 hypothetical protein [Sphingomonadales bacterium]
MSDDPATLLGDTEAALVEADRKLNSAAGLLLIQAAPPADRARAGQAMVDTGLAIQALRRAQLDAIAGQLAADAAALRLAIGDLNKALASFKAVKPVLDGVAKLLGVVARIVTLV